MKNFKIITILSLATTLFSCTSSFLEPEPTSAVNSAIYYTTDAQVLTAVYNMYDGIQGVNSLADTDVSKHHSIQIEYYLTEMRSTNTKSKSSEGEAAQFESWNVGTTNGIVSDYYESMYNIIYRANVVLENLDAALPANKAKYEGEAKFVRAYAYFNLVRLFGDVPYVDRTFSYPFTQDDIFTQYNRVNKNDIYQYIITDLKRAATNLATNTSTKNRATKAAALGLLAKAYLTVGNYIEAQNTCDLITGYSLQPFKNVFYQENNGEIIFAIGFNPDTINDSQNFSAEWLNAIGRTSGVNYVTTDAKTAIDALGGSRKLYSYRVDPVQISQLQVAKYLPVADTNLGINSSAASPRLAGNDWIVLRYADVLLMKVEAIMAGQASTTVPAALTAFETVRLRAGLTGDSDGEITKQELLDERRVEFAFENQYLFDLMRFNEAQNVLSAYSNLNGLGFTATDILLPIPQKEINLGRGIMSQNPGY